MKNTKLNKILILLASAIMFIASSFAMICVNAKAESVSLSFISGLAYDTATIETVEGDKNDMLKFTATSEKNSLIFNNTLCIEDFEIKFSMGNEITSVKLVLTSTALYATGVEIEEGVYNTQVENEITVSNTGAENYVVYVKVEDNQVKYTVNGGAESTCAYKIANVYKPTAKLMMVASTESSGEVKISYVNQKKSEISDDTKYNQYFELNNTVFKYRAKPIIILKADFLSCNNNVINGKINTLSYSTCSVFSTDSSLVGAVEGANVNNHVWFENDNTSSWVIFNLDGSQLEGTEMDFALKYGEDKLDYITVNVYNNSFDTEAPEYINDADALASYKKAVELAGLSDVEKGISIILGEDYEIPSLESLVKDNFTAYKNLTYKVYYRTPEVSSTLTNSMSIPTDSAGRYEFYVVFTDEKGNSMEKDDFYTIDETNSSVITPGALYDYVFNFTLQDNTPIIVKPAESQGEGYVGITYNAIGFTITGNHSTEYALYYNSDIEAQSDDEGWVEIKSIGASETATTMGITEEEFAKLQEYAYDGKLSFKPLEKGSYKIVCTAYSKTKVRNSFASTVIRVTDQKTTVTPANHWLQENYLSVIFLGIGTLCLIAIIVLIFVKPKEKQED